MKRRRIRHVRSTQVRPSILAWLAGDESALARDNAFLRVSLIAVEDDLRAAHDAGDRVRVEAILRCAKAADTFFDRGHGR